MGALPLPDDAVATKNFLQAVETRIGEKHAVTIYPEAHIWPYYTKNTTFSGYLFSLSHSVKGAGILFYQYVSEAEIQKDTANGYLCGWTFLSG